MSSFKAEFAAQKIVKSDGELVNTDVGKEAENALEFGGVEGIG